MKYNMFGRHKFHQGRGFMSNKHTVIRVDKIIFKSKQNIPWRDVKEYLSKFMGKVFIVSKYNDEIVFNYESKNEYVGSNYTVRARGAIAKAKANIVQVLPELVCSATNRRWDINKSPKHIGNAKGGWYRYDVYFEIPVKSESEDLYSWNSYRATLVVRINDGKLYFYDIINIKKEARNLGAS